jgi:hypothetical protein
MVNGYHGGMAGHIVQMHQSAGTSAPVPPEGWRSTGYGCIILLVLADI